MLLSDIEIKRYLNNGIIIEPFNPEQLNNVSYDLTLGNNFAFHNNVVRFQDVKAHNDNFSIQFYGDSQSGCWEVLTVEKGVLLHPQQRCLAHSREYAGGTICKGEPEYSITSYLQCTSTAARIGLTACLCAGWGDVGFISRWTFEVVNLSPKPVFLPVGGVLAQLCFERVKTPERIYGKHQGNYQFGETLFEVKKSWNPGLMIPRKLKVYE